MITYEEGKARFIYRVVGIAINGNRVLLHRAEQDDFWALPGGRGEFMEPAQETLKREMREELGVEIHVERLVWAVENFYEDENLSFHELGFYFLMTFPRDSRLYEKGEPFAGEEKEIRLIFQWHELDELANLPLYPAFLRTALKAIPEVTEHVVHTDVKE